MSGRLHKSILNAEVSLLFYFLSLSLAFFSRKTFLDCLGAEFIGLTGTLGNILGYLNLAELGIGTSISYFLYKPIQQKDMHSINEIMSVFGYLYKVIGTIIFVLALLVSLFFPLIFNNNEVEIALVFFSFYSILGSSLIGYFINYRQILLSADQKNYLVAIYTKTAAILKTILQIYLANKYNNPYLWVAIEFLFGIIACIILNWKIDKEYPWLKCNKTKGKTLVKKYPNILTKAKQAFIHRLKFFIIERSDEIFIFAFVSLRMVAYYNNYMMIIGKVVTIFVLSINNVGAGIGNLIAEGNHHNTMKVFWELSAIRYFISGIVCFSLYSFVEPFITLWLGKEYILPQSTLILLLIFFFIKIASGAVDSFIFAMGLYADTWSAWVELFLNLTITLIAGYYKGIDGILLGKLISMFFIIVFWKPYYLFRSGLKEKYSTYWSMTMPYLIILIISYISAMTIIHYCIHISISNFLDWLLFCIVGSVIYLIINVPLFIIYGPGSKDLLHRIDFKSIINIIKIKK